MAGHTERLPESGAAFHRIAATLLTVEHWLPATEADGKALEAAHRYFAAPTEANRLAWHEARRAAGYPEVTPD